MVDKNLEDNGIKMYLPHNEEKYAVAEKLIRTLKNEIYKYMTWISKNVYIDKDYILSKYNNTYHCTTKMKPFHVKTSIYIDFH